MFLVNSRLTPFTAASFSSTREVLHLLDVPLLPKLRGYFAEFLREVSLARLSLFDSPTCVGLRYGRLGEQMDAFLGTSSGDALRAEP